MQWKQFFTPVDSIDVKQAEQMLKDREADQIVLLDVRQPGEYSAGHLPGTVHIPLAELDKRLSELDRDKPTVVYCAIGGRSRVAAQMLSGRGFREVYNLSGGIKAWQSAVAVGAPEQGLELFSGAESVEEAIAIGFGLEQGLREFYLDVGGKVQSQAARDLFAKLAEIEILHQDRLLDLHRQVTGSTVSRQDFESRILQPAMEGGLTTQAYLERFQPDWESLGDILSLALSIEAQALDLYQRAADHAADKETARILRTVADEERQHMERLGQLMDTVR